MIKNLFNKYIYFFRKYATFFYCKLIKPNSNNEDVARVEFILNSILLASIFLTLAAFLSVVSSAISKHDLYKGDPPFYVAGILVSFVVLLVLSRSGLVRFASHTLVALFVVPISYGIYYFGVDNPQTLLSYAFVIVIAGVLIGTRFTFILTSVIALIILIAGFLQINGFYLVNIYWKNENLRIDEVYIFAITFFVIATISWLSNREIEKSLIRARVAEKELRKERDLLEVKVKERTAEIEKLQFEKTKQMQNFVEFGRNASGLFHDMVNPVQAAILALYNLKKNAPINDRVGLDNSVDEVVGQMERARKIISAARNQVTRQEINIKFDPEEQIAFVFQMLSFKAKHSGVKLVYSLGGEQHMLTGNPLSFHRLIAGLVSNAIDSYDGDIFKTEKQKTVTVTSENSDGYMILSVSDNGNGIKKENQKKIFELFFTTKGMEKGTGIGLSICKEIAEKEFGGEITFNSEEGKGATFIIKLPLMNPEKGE